jgi:hypothetical protein
LCGPHAPGLVFLANLVVRATARKAAYVADLKPHSERCLLKSDIPCDWFRHGLSEKDLLIADTASVGDDTGVGRHSSALRLVRTCAHIVVERAVIASYDIPVWAMRRR